MNLLHQIRKSIWQCSCIICNLLNIALAGLALSLLGLLTLNYLHKSVPVPDGIASWIIQKSSPENLQANWSGIAFDLHAGIYLTGFELRDSQTEQILLTAEETYIKWTPLRLLVPGVPVAREIDARNLQIYIPASHSPSGLNEPVISIKHVYSRIERGSLIIDSLLVQTGGVRLYLNGYAPISTLSGYSMPSSDSESPHATRQNLYPLLSKLARIPKDFNADITLNWELLPNNENVFVATGFLPEFRFRDIGLEEIFGNAVFSLSGNQLTLKDVGLNGILIYMDKLPDIPLLKLPQEQVPIPFQLSAEGQEVPFEGQLVPSHIRLSLNPDHPNLKFRHLILEADMAQQGISSFDWILKGPNAFASGNASSSPDATASPMLTAPQLLEFRAYLPNSTIYQFFDVPLPNRLLVGTKADFIRLNGSFNLDDFTLQGSAISDGLNIGQTDFDYLFSRLFLNPQKLVLDNIRVTKSFNEHAAGSYSQHFPSSRFSLNAAGFIFPSSLDSILGDWWINIFTHIETARPLPGDVTVWGHWRDIRSIRSVTKVHGEGVHYRGVRIPRLELRVRSNRDWAYLDELKGTFPDGEIAGKIAIRSGLSQNDRHRAYQLDLTSTAPWDAVLGATGLEGLGILDFKEGNPYLSVMGTMWRDSGKGFDSENTAQLDLQIFQRQGTCNLGSLQLAGLSASGHVRGNHLLLDGLSGQFAEGIFTGHLTISNWQDKGKMRKDIDIDLINANYNTALDQLSRFVGMDSATSETGPSDEKGRLDAELLLKFGQNLETYSGRGDISIREGKLGTVHMFGELSRLLGGLGLGFTSVEMDTMSMNWNLTGPALEIRNGMVTGPALNLTLEGWVDLETQGLQMKSEVTLFSGLFSKMLTPVSDTLQLSLVGTLEDPEWNVRFNPFGWAINRMTTPRESGGN